MDILLIIFSALLLTISLFGLIGNIRFVFITWREKHIHKQLLLFLTILHIPYCIIIILDAIRIFIGISLTRASCLRFIGAISALLSLSQSLLHSFIGIELIVMISAPFLFRRLKIWWFFIPVAIAFLTSGYLIYMSLISNDDWPVQLCSPQTALATEFMIIGNTIIFANNILVLLLYIALLVLIYTKMLKLHDSLMKRLTISSTIIAALFVFSWFTDIVLIRFAVQIGELLDVLPSSVLTAAVLPATLTFSQTHYVYFFVSSKNREAFRKRGPVALFSGDSEEHERPHQQQ